LTPPRKAHHRRVIGHRAQPKNKAKAVLAAAIRQVPPRELPRGAAVGVALVPVAPVTAGTASFRVPLPLWILLALSLVILAIALTPPRVLPGSAAIVFSERRESAVYAGTAALLGIVLGFLIAQVGS
jgi:hypothetical protein